MSPTSYQTAPPRIRCSYNNQFFLNVNLCVVKWCPVSVISCNNGQFRCTEDALVFLDSPLAPASVLVVILLQGVLPFQQHGYFIQPFFKDAES